MATTNADVLILGSGLAGSISALCLVRQGLDVVLIDQGTHPRFALGESTTTPSSLWLRLIAERYDAKELLAITSAEALTRSVAPTSGVKNNFGFLYHTPGERQPSRAWQAVIPQAFLSEYEFERQAAYNEMHYFRQDVDAYLWTVALQAGVKGRPATKVAEIEFDDDGVSLETTTGEELRGRFLIDASGFRSPVAQRLGLRDEVPQQRTHSRTLFTHMAGVTNFEDTGIVASSMALWSQGTLHHFFDGGWVWVIPFGNHRDSTNRLCSVGVSFDSRRFPKREGVSPDEEWAEFLGRFPAIAEQFRNAVAVRPWVHTDRVQYSSSTCIGDRFWLTPHAAATVDALYSIGNINTFQGVATGVGLVLRAFETGEFRKEQFQPMQDLMDAMLRFQDRLVYGNYVATRDPRLLATWIALWSLTDTARIRRMLVPFVTYLRSHRPEVLDFCVEDPASIVTGMGMVTEVAETDFVLGHLDRLCDIMQELDEGQATVEDVLPRLNNAVEDNGHYHIELGEIEKAFSRLPWNLAPLSYNGVRCHGSVFLTPHEMNTLGVEEQC